jgi:hypothetical protein
VDFGPFVAADCRKAQLRALGSRSEDVEGVGPWRKRPRLLLSEEDNQCQSLDCQNKLQRPALATYSAAISGSDTVVIGGSGASLGAGELSQKPGLGKLGGRSALTPETTSSVRLRIIRHRQSYFLSCTVRSYDPALLWSICI